VPEFASDSDIQGLVGDIESAVEGIRSSIDEITYADLEKQ